MFLSVWFVTFFFFFSYETFPVLNPDLLERPHDRLRVPAKGSPPSSPAPRRTKQVTWSRREEAVTPPHRLGVPERFFQNLDSRMVRFCFGSR